MNEIIPVETYHFLKRAPLIKKKDEIHLKKKSIVCLVNYTSMYFSIRRNVALISEHNFCLFCHDKINTNFEINK